MIGYASWNIFQFSFIKMSQQIVSQNMGEIGEKDHGGRGKMKCNEVIERFDWPQAVTQRRMWRGNIICLLNEPKNREINRRVPTKAQNLFINTLKSKRFTT